MLIRSQDRKCLKNMDMVDSLLAKKVSDVYHIQTFNGDSKDLIAVYSTEEKAIKVLDMIEDIYTRRSGVVHISQNGTASFDTNAREVFQMPQESEVE